ncbi:glycoside hydrolase family 18 protein [Trichoderma citrinoviride]|uniref:chitinase n=1 Tax=Trichoderma citrinoviride TaxID=58853 RepID=D6N0X9_9HYPO|nr:glycoside hydrolase family 18 protein [Trichoderma citrinoviride]ADF57301.1 chitinase chi18-13 [Trichoderma citrinoviride]PTB62220.1 glycoside hydrolase family 18 protein [Trichoderma citrinoviride]
MFFSKALAAAAGLLATAAYAAPTMEKRAAGGKVVVYWGAEDDSTTLAQVCADPSYDIVILAFLSRFFAGGGYPELSLSTLGGPSAAQRAAGATNLQDGTPLVPAIQACQAAGKPVILSMGGAVDFSAVTLTGDSQGQQIADTVWNLFLGGTANPSLRPFGSVKLDGVDMDNETGNPTGYLAMAQRFKSNFAQDPSKKYYLTAAPQCPFPDASEPLNVCQLADYIWVQFYNNGNCNIAQSGFNTAVQNWSKNIGNATLFIGALASGADGDSGFVSSSTLLSAYQGVSNLNLPNIGGIMLWEAQLAVKNGNYQQVIKAGISGGSSAPPPPPPPPSNCSWAGHCAGASCGTDDDCSDDLTCNGGVCGAPGSTPAPTCSWEGHCLGASCGNDNDCSDPYSCKNGVCSN